MKIFKILLVLSCLFLTFCGSDDAGPDEAYLQAEKLEGNLEVDSVATKETQEEVVDFDCSASCDGDTVCINKKYAECLAPSASSSFVSLTCTREGYASVTLRLFDTEPGKGRLVCDAKSTGGTLYWYAVNIPNYCQDKLEDDEEYVCTEEEVESN